MTYSILVPIPRADFDPTEVAVPWRVLTEAGVAVRFATTSRRAGRGMYTATRASSWTCSAADAILPGQTFSRVRECRSGQVRENLTAERYLAEVRSLLDTDMERLAGRSKHRETAPMEDLSSFCGS